MVRGDDNVYRQVNEVILRPDDVSCAKFSADGKKLFSCGKENALIIWDPATGKEAAQLMTRNQNAAAQQSTRNSGGNTHLSLSGDGKVLASGTFYGEIKTWDLENQKEIAAFDNGESIYALALSADGKRLLSSSRADVILWDVAKKEPIGRFKGVQGIVGHVAFSPDEKLVVAQGINYVVWDVKTFEQLAAFEVSPVKGFAITLDGKTLITCDQKGNVKVHEMPKR
jgi:WD40 repeat protein